MDPAISPTSLKQSDIVAGLSVLLFDCLGSKERDQVLIIFDDSFRPYLDAAVALIIERHLRTTFIEIPRAYQSALISWETGTPHASEVPLCVSAALGEATVVLNCLDGNLSTGPLRRAILQQTRRHECRLAHIPGISDEIISILTRSPIADIVKAADILAWGLGEAHRAEILSYDSQQREWRLELDLGGWDDEPLMSPGVIYPHSWGNVPPGEVFCCPDHRCVNGTICINGSIPGLRLDGGEEAILEFRNGSLVHWYPETSPVAEFLNSELISAKQRGDSHWNTFAELGIGLNPAVTRLTGNSLLDEKALGTIHIAIGDNTGFGHDVKADRHADMETVAPTLLLDGLIALDRGRMSVDKLGRWRQELRPNPLHLSPETKLSLIAAKIDIWEGMPVRRLQSAGRIGYLHIATAENAELIRRLIRALP